MNLETVLNALRHGTEIKNKTKTRLLFPESRDEKRLNAFKSSKEYAELRKTAEKLLREPIVSLPFSVYRLFDVTGSRDEYEELYFAHRERLCVFGGLAIADGGKEYIDALADAIWAICDEYTWCLPAHLQGDSLSKEGKVAGTWPHEQMVDLFASETAFSLSEIIYLVGEKLPEVVKTRAIKNIKSRVIEPYASLFPAFHWETLHMNWAAVCAGSVGSAAIYLYDSDETLCQIIYRAVSSMESFLSGFPEDGSCLEGPSYWAYGFGFFTYFAQLLKDRTGGEIDLMADEHVEKVAAFQQRSYLENGYPITFSDMDLWFEFIPGLTSKLSQIYPNVKIPPKEYSTSVFGDKRYRWPHFIRNVFWTEWDKDTPCDDFACEDFDYFKDAGIFIARSKNQKAAFSAKGGCNNEPHNHNDIGSFVYIVDGKLFFTDPGRGIYSKDYFGDKRYSFVANGAQGHSVPVVDGVYQLEGAQYKANIIKAQHDGSTDLFFLDLTSAYDCANLLNFTRAFSFDRKTAALIIRDNFKFAKKGAVTERFVTFAKPRACGNDAVLEIDGTTVRVSCQAANARLKIGCDDFPTEKEKKILYHIDFEPEPFDSAEIVVTISKEN